MKPTGRINHESRISEFEIMIGASSEDTPLSEKIRLL